MDGLYLRSELLWRQGQLPGAMEALSSALASSTGSGKCQERLAFLAPIAAELQQASLAMDSGRSSCKTVRDSDSVQHCQPRRDKSVKAQQGSCCTSVHVSVKAASAQAVNVHLQLLVQEISKHVKRGAAGRCRASGAAAAAGCELSSSHREPLASCSKAASRRHWKTAVLPWQLSQALQTPCT